jgi:predicted exporter
MTRPGAAATLIWAVLAALAAVIVTRGRYTTDLSAFLPRQPSATQQLLIEQLRSGPAARLILVAIQGADAATRARLSRSLAQALRADARFAAVANGDPAQLARDRDFLFVHRYLLSDAVTPQRFSAAGLHAAIADTLAELASPAGALIKSVLVDDPTGELPGLFAALAAGHTPPHLLDAVWASPDGARALLLAQTRAAGSDTDAQQAACEAIRRAFAAAGAALPAGVRGGVRLLLSGPPVFAVSARALIKHEVLRLSLASSVLIALLLLAAYRSLPALLLTLVPIASGALAGVAAVALGFQAVHGMTLGFGVTLIGEAVDYSIYLFIQRSVDWRHAVWPTIRLGMLTSICGFAVLLPSAFTGLAQLGLYSVTGLVAAALVTRYLLPAWLPARFAIADLSGAGARLARWLPRLARARAALALVALAALATLAAHRGPLWDRQLSVLNPIPLADQQLDDELRAQLGAPDARYLVVVAGADQEAALAGAAALDAPLSALLDAGVIAGFDSPVRYLPPAALQRERRASLPQPGQLRASLASALEDLPLRAERLEPFVRDVESARSAGLIGRADLEGTSFGAALDALLVRNGAGWSALLPLTAPRGSVLAPPALARLRDALAAQPGTRAALLDIEGEADTLYSGYLSQMALLSLAGFAAIVLLLLGTLRSAARVARVIAPLLLAVLTVAALLVALGRHLTILHLVGMLLIVAVGSNYALFFDRAGASPHQGSLALTLASLVLANLATVLTFGVLACSQVPALADLGATVAPGALLALCFSAVLSRAADPLAAGAADGRPR